MKHCYSLAFNVCSQVWQVIAETAKSHIQSPQSKPIEVIPWLCLSSLICSSLINAVAHATPALDTLPASALPTGGQVVAGQSTISQSGNQLNVLQSTHQSIINWNTFNIGAQAQVNFVQPNTGAISLNRVLSADSSYLFGNLTANGQVWLINPNGILFGQGAQVNMGSILASTLNITDDDFLNGYYQFSGHSGNIVNQGNIVANHGGYVAMLAPEVRNEGIISAIQGTVAMAAGDAMTLDFNGTGLVNVQVNSANINTLLENKHLIQVGGGQVLMSSLAADGLMTSVINNRGNIEANTMVNEGGIIRLTGAKLVTNNGEISAQSSMGKGGKVHLLGENVGVLGNGSINVSGNTGGGTILVGGDLQGNNAQIQNANKTFINSGAKLIADATNAGNGGKVIVWANDITRYYGSISAIGGANGGNGGFAEVSGKRLLNFMGKADLGAANGVGGNLLLDPLNITLTTTDANTAGFTVPGDITEAFTDDLGLTSTFNVNAGGSFSGIAAGSTITLQATNNITVGNAFDLLTATGSANNSLVLQANNNITVNAGATVTASGTGNITFQADADNSGAGALAINAGIATAGGAVNLSGFTVASNSSGSIATAGGAVNVTNSGTSTLSGVISGAGTQFNKNGSGTIIITGSNSYTGATNINQGTLRTSSAIPNTSAVNVAAPATLLVNVADVVGSLSGAGTVTLSSNLTAGGDNSTTTYSGVMSGAGNFTKAGTGILTLSGNNTYTGLTQVQAGTLSAANANALGGTGTGTTVTSGATLNVNNVTLAAEPITISGNGAGGVGVLTGTGAATLTGSVTTVAASRIATTSAASILTMSGAITSVANALNIAGLGDVVAINAANDFGSIGITGAKNVSIFDANDFAFTTSTLTGNLTARALGNVTLTNAIGTTGGDINLAGVNFINNAGATALSASGRWLVYSTAPATDTFGSLLSGNQAVWNTSYPTAIVQAGNRYVFSTSPTLTVTSTNQTKTYGQNGAPTVANAYTATGFVNAATYGGVFTQDVIANSLAGSATSSGSIATANIGSYAVDVTPVTATTGYTLTKSNAGNLTVNPATLTITANNQAKTYGQTFTFLGTEFTSTGLQNAETIGTTILNSAGAINTANVTGSPYVINASNAAGGTFNAGNYAISYVNGALAITPAALTITANNVSKIQGSNNPMFTSTAIGFMNGETLTALTGTLAYNTPATLSSPVGIYAISPFGLTSGNYTIAYVDGLLNITPIIAPVLSILTNPINKNALTRPDHAVLVCNANLDSSEWIINGLNDFGLNDISYKAVFSQPLVGEVVANATTSQACLNTQ